MGQNRWRSWRLAGPWLLAAAALAGGEALGQALPILPPVPPPAATAILDIQEGQLYPFPWVTTPPCRKVSESGCFKVEGIAADKVVIKFPRFEVEGGTRIPAGFAYRTPVTTGGTEYELYVVKLGGGREEWVYAAVESATGTGARLRFMKYPAFVTEKARISSAVTLDAQQGTLQETYTVDAEEPITLIGLSSMPRAIPGGRLVSVQVDGTPVSFPYAHILNLNLPPGRHTVIAHVALAKSADSLTLEGTLFEPRKMFLIQALALRVLFDPSTRAAPSVAVATVGLPAATWESFRSTIAVDPQPSSSEEGRLSLLYRFPPTPEIRLRTRPRVPVGRNNYPVMITVNPAGVD
jgi:hypothetical protein